MLTKLSNILRRKLRNALFCNQIRNSCINKYYAGGNEENKLPVNAYYNYFTNLELPKNKIFATYVWIDGSGINMKSKDRILGKVPSNLEEVPKWSFDGSSSGFSLAKDSEILLIPTSIYKDPFRSCPHLIILCETYYGDGMPTPTNNRAHCAKLLDKLSDQDPWFGIEQEYVILGKDFWPLGWPKHGFPLSSNKSSYFSYCGIGPYVSGREIVECHARACVFAGLDYEGSNAEVMKSAWEFQIGTTPGIKAADDLWLGRYLLARVAENFGAVITYNPKPMGEDQPGIGCHHNFSTQKMRCDEGIVEIERVCKTLCEKHEVLMKNYGLGDGEENRKRLTGKFETTAFDTCTWGVADRSVAIRIQRSVMSKRKGFLEDRRPAGDCDPYRVCANLAETCL